MKRHCIAHVDKPQIGLGLGLGLGFGRGGASAPAYTHNMVVFDGTNDYLRKTSGAGFLPDGTYGTFAFKLKRNVVGGGVQYIWHGYDGITGFNYLRFTAANTLEICLADSGFTAGVSLATLASGLNSTTAAYTGHIAFSGAGAGTVRCWINGTETTESLAGITYDYGPGALNFSTLVTHSIGTQQTGALRLEGNLGLFWFAMGTTSAHYITDPTAFYASGDVDLGSGTVSGVTPRLFYGGQQVATNWNAGTNQGSAGNMTMNGAVSDAT